MMATRISKDMATLRQAVKWIAEEDAHGDNDDADTISGYLTVHLVADLFDVQPIEVARKVVRHRAKNA